MLALGARDASGSEDASDCTGQEGARQRRAAKTARLAWIVLLSAAVLGLFAAAAFAVSQLPNATSWPSLREQFRLHWFSPSPILAFNDSTPAPERYRLVRKDLRTSYIAGDILHLHVDGPGPDIDRSSWLRLDVVGEDGQLFSGIPTNGAAHGWVVPLLEPGNYSVDVRLIVYGVPDFLDRPSPWLPPAEELDPPAWATCYNDTVTDGTLAFVVLPAAEPSDVFARARTGIRALPASIRTSAMDSVGTLVGQSCYHHADMLWGWWRWTRAQSMYHAYSGCSPLSARPEGVRAFVQELPDSPVRWVRTLGDSNTRFCVKDGLPGRLMLIPPGTYPPEQELPDGEGTYPCIYGINPHNQKDEQFLCLLFSKNRALPLVVTMEWFTLAETNSEPLDVVYRRTLREAFGAAYHNATLMNKFFVGRFGTFDERMFPHTLETLLAPWPELRTLAYADHTLVSFGSHNAEATTAEWSAQLDTLTSLWPRSRHEPELVKPDQPKREDLTFVYTTPVNSGMIPGKFGRQFLIRNNLRIAARNALARAHLSSSSLLSAQAPSPDGVSAQAYVLDFYGTPHALLEGMRDAVHFMPKT